MESNTYKTLVIDGTAYKTLYTNKYANRKPWAAPKVDEITNAIPGTVMAICVKVGDTVKQGDTICLFEAMKMQNIIRSPHSGVIKAINVKQGDKLPKGTVMLTVATM